MATRYKTQAFVFKKSDCNECDRVFSVFAKDFGRIELFGKAIRKMPSKLRAGIDIFFSSEVEFIQGKNRKTLTDASVIKRFTSIHKSPFKIEVSQKIADVLDSHLKGEEKDEKMSDLINESFKNLDEFKPQSAAFKLLPYYYFLWNAMSLLGYQPQIQKCNECGQKLNPYGIYFSNKLGGVICKSCLPKDTLSIKINSDFIKLLRLILNKDWDILKKIKITPKSKKIFEQVSDSYYLYT